MAKQLFVLRGVPDDEADEIRRLLDERGFDYYETPAGNWGISMPALWLRDEHQFDEARELILNYQKQRFAGARAEYRKQAELGQRRTLLDELKERPLSVVAYSLIAFAILYFSIKPFLALAP